MKTAPRSALALAICAAMLSAAPVGAQSYSAEWLHRQFTADHRAPLALRSAPPRSAAASAPSASDVSGHAFAASWLERQLAGKPAHPVALEGVAGRAGPASADDPDGPLHERWLKRQFSTDHRG
ncbi:MAG TPA: hypothetical protein PL143_02355 [Rhodocyclaceae bacterium]|nr:hypothetical protein [Rhodocyclaceae bacterium]